MSQLAKYREHIRQHFISADDTSIINARFDGLLSERLVAPSPGSALRLMRERFGIMPNRLGSNCPAFAEVRLLINALSAAMGRRLENALLLVAPHTHWPSGAIVYRFKRGEGRYHVGPASVREPLLAVSFVFSRNGPMPYEWVDRSCGLDVELLTPIWEAVCQLNDAVVAAKWYLAPFPLGISINHRFKAPFDPPVRSTHESPSPDQSGVSYIIPHHSAEHLDEFHQDQVGWSSSIVPEINDEEARYLKVVDSILAEADDHVVEKLFTEINNHQYDV